MNKKKGLVTSNEDIFHVEQMNISRRKFVKSAGAVVGTTAATPK